MWAFMQTILRFSTIQYNTTVKQKPSLSIIVSSFSTIQYNTTVKPISR